MSNKVKLNKQKGKKRLKLKKIKTPCKIGFTYHLGDTAGCGHIRCIFPALILNNIMTPDLKVEAFYTNKYTPLPQAYANTTFAVFQRSATPEQLKMIQHFKTIRQNSSIIYEIDDNLFDIPDWNFAKSFYIEHKESIEMILRSVDGIVTSTDYLRKEYLRYNKNVQVIPNHLPKFIWGGEGWVDRKNEKPKILYAGSMNHFSLEEGSDQGDFGSELINYILETMDKYEWHFVGGVPNRIKAFTNGSDKIKYHEWQSVLNLAGYLRALNIDVALAPLEDNRFNMSKSNIKVLESTALGLPVICSDVGPYNGLPGAVKTTTQMIERIEELANSPDSREEQWYNMNEAVKDILYWEDNGNINKYLNKYLRLVKMTL